MEFKNRMKLCEVKAVLNINKKFFGDFSNSSEFIIPDSTLCLLTAFPTEETPLKCYLRYASSPRKVRSLRKAELIEYKKEVYYLTRFLGFKFGLQEVSSIQCTHLSLCSIEVEYKNRLIKYTNDLNLIGKDPAVEFRYVQTNNLFNYVIKNHTVTNFNKRLNLKVINDFVNEQ